MSKALEKKTKLNPLRGYEVECKLFIYHTLKLFPDITVVEMRRFIAKHLRILVSYDWVRKQTYEIKNSQDFLREVGEIKGITDPQVIALEKEASDNVKLITADSRKQVQNIVNDSALMARDIKGRMMGEVDVRLDAAPETFTNDELIRGSKAMHEIETNSDNSTKVQVNLIDVVGGLEQFNEALNELRKKQTVTVVPGGGEVTPDSGEVQVG